MNMIEAVGKSNTEQTSKLRVNGVLIQVTRVEKARITELMQRGAMTKDAMTGIVGEERASAIFSRDNGTTTAMEARRKEPVQLTLLETRDVLHSTVTQQLDMVSRTNSFYKGVSEQVVQDFLDTERVPCYIGGESKRRVFLAPTGAGKTRVAMMDAVMSALRNYEKDRMETGNAEQLEIAKGMNRHVCIICSPYKVIAFQFFEKLSTDFMSGKRPILGKYMVGENTDGNRLTPYYKKVVSAGVAQMKKDEYDRMFDMEVYAQSDVDKKDPAEQGKTKVRTVIAADFVSGTYEMVGVFLRAVEQQYRKAGVIIHGVFDEFQDAFKSKEKRFNAAVYAFDKLASISNTFSVVSGSYTMLKDVNIRSIFEQGGFQRTEIIQSPKLVFARTRTRSEILTEYIHRLLDRSHWQSAAWVNNNMHIVELCKIEEEYPELIWIADTIAHPGRGTCVVIQNMIHESTTIMKGAMLTLSWLQDREYAETGKVSYWAVPVFDEHVMSMANLGPAQKKNDRGETLKEWEAAFEAENGKTYGAWRKEKNAQFSAMSDEEKREYYRKSRERDAYEPRFVYNSYTAWKHVKFGVTTQVSKESKDVMKRGINIHYIRLCDVWTEMRMLESPPTDDFYIPAGVRESIVDRQRATENGYQYNTTLNTTQDVRNFCLRCGVFINNAKENYVSQMMNEFAERKVSPRVWIATQIIGIGADMPNVRRLVCLQNKSYCMTDELENQVMGRCDRERIGRLIFLEQVREENGEIVKNQEKYISMENAAFMYRSLLTNDVYNRYMKGEVLDEELARMPITTFLVNNKEQIAQREDLISLDVSMDIQFGLVANTSAFGAVDLSVDEEGDYGVVTTVTDTDIAPEGVLMDSETMGSAQLFMQSVFVVDEMKVVALEEMKEQFKVLSDFTCMFNSPSVMNYAPYYKLAHSTLIANLTFEALFKQSAKNKGAYVAKKTFGELFLKIDPSLETLIKPGEPLRHSKAVDMGIRSAKGVKRDKDVIIKPLIALVNIDRVFDLVDKAVKVLSLKELASLYIMLTEITDGTADIDSRTTVGLDALSLAEYSRNTYRKDAETRKKMLDALDEKFRVSDETRRLMQIPTKDMIAILRPYITAQEEKELRAVCGRLSRGQEEKGDGDTATAIVQGALGKIHALDKVRATRKEGGDGEKRRSVIKDKERRKAIDEKTGTRLSYHGETFGELSGMQSAHAFYQSQSNIEWKGRMSWLAFFQMALFMLYPSPVQVLIRDGDTYAQTTIGPSMKNATQMIANGMAVINNLDRMTLSDLKYVIGNKMLSGTNIRAQTAKFLQSISSNASIYGRLCTAQGKAYNAQIYDRAALVDRGLIQIYALGEISLKLAAKFDPSTFGNVFNAGKDMLQKMQGFFGDTRIYENAGNKDKTGEFYFRTLFEQGSDVEERFEFTMDKATAKNLSYLRKSDYNAYKEILGKLKEGGAEYWDIVRASRVRKEQAKEKKIAEEEIAAKSTFLDTDDDEEIDEASLVALRAVKLVNFSNACYMNSLVQCLYAIQCVRESVRGAGGEIDAVLSSVFDRMDAQSTDIALALESTGVYEALHVTPREQEDPHEVLTQILDTSSALGTLFEITEKTSTEEAQSRADKAHTLNVYPQADSPLEALVAKELMTEERVEGRMLRKEFEISSSVLAVHIIRYDSRSNKKLHKVSIQKELSVCGHRYTLRAFLAHQGYGEDIEHGHYTAFVYDKDTEILLHMNDDISELKATAGDHVTEDVDVTYKDSEDVLHIRAEIVFYVLDE